MKPLLTALTLLMMFGICLGHDGKDTYNATVVDQTDTETEVYDLHLRTEVALDCYRGQARHSIPFKNIRSIQMQGSVSKGPTGDHTMLTDVTLLSGEVLKVYTSTHHYYVWEGSAPYGSFCLHNSKAKSITFQHGGVGRKCSLCERVYYDIAWFYCPQDGGNLEEK
jgi:hypothetical protein